jgi:hypothetical protein
MQIIMRKTLICYLSLSLFVVLSSCASTKKVENVEKQQESALPVKKVGDNKAFNYEIECAGNGVQGTYLVKVWSYVQDPSDAVALCKKNAVHGVIFKGFVGTGGCVSQTALVPEYGAEQTHKDFFKQFFHENKGEYLKYVNLTSTPQEIIQIGHNYKVAHVLVVYKDELRKTLENAGIIESLSHGF